MNAIEAYLDFAIEIAWQAGRSTLQHFQSVLDIEWKQDESPVTVADREAEQLMRRLIRQKYPDHAILGEEFDAEGREEAPVRWVLDPIDGTQSFVHGVPLYAVLVGLEVEGVPVVGVANFPALGELVAAGRRAGCRWNGRPCRTSTVARLSEALICYTAEPHPAETGKAAAWRRLLDGSRAARGWSDAYGHILVATGRADAMFDPVIHPWDGVALLPILEEAGGTFTDWEGNATAWGGDGMSTNGNLLDEILWTIHHAGNTR